MRTTSLRTACCLLFALAATSSVDACPTCKEALAEQPTDASTLADGFNKSILFMLSVPISLMTVGGLVVHRAVKQGVLPEM